MGTREISRSAPTRATTERRLLYNLLLALKEGEIADYETLNREIRGDVQAADAHFLTGARQWLLDHDGIVTEAVPGCGIRRIENGEHTAVMQMHRVRAHGHARRAIQKAQCVDYDKLSTAERRAYVAERVHLGLLQQVSSDAASREIAAAPDPEGMSNADAMRRLADSWPT